MWGSLKPSRQQHITLETHKEVYWSNWCSSGDINKFIYNLLSFIKKVDFFTTETAIGLTMDHLPHWDHWSSCEQTPLQQVETVLVPYRTLILPRWEYYSSEYSIIHLYSEWRPRVARPARGSHTTRTRHHGPDQDNILHHDHCSDNIRARVLPSTIAPFRSSARNGLYGPW